jgi:hypothetical protein
MTPTTRLLDCGHEPSPHSDCTTGTAFTLDRKEICWDCSHARELAELKTARRFVAYLSGDGATLTDWPGRRIAKVTRLWSVRNNLAGKLYRFRATDLHGAQWFGTSVGPNMLARMHRAKASA